MNKPELKSQLKESREQFSQVLDILTNEQLISPGVEGHWSVKDILVHIMLWESELVKLLWQVQQGQPPSTAHFAKDYDIINEQWYQEHRERPLERILPDFNGVRQQTIRRLEGFSDSDLNDPQRYSWLKDAPLWQWIAASTFKHEEKHLATIQAWLGK